MNICTIEFFFSKILFRDLSLEGRNEGLLKHFKNIEAILHKEFGSESFTQFGVPSNVNL
jgi:hypothetical protein